MINLPTPYAAARLGAFLEEHLSWSAWWDKKYGLWRAAEDDPQSELYVESRDADAVIRYISTHARDTCRIRLAPDIQFPS
jgi:hypothetical protein